MTITGTVQGGKIILPPDIDWPNGAVVRVELVSTEIPTLFDAFKEFDGMAADLPPDLAENLDQHLHGRPPQ